MQLTSIISDETSKGVRNYNNWVVLLRGLGLEVRVRREGGNLSGDQSDSEVLCPHQYSLRKL